jgi:hypothetical protein
MGIGNVKMRVFFNANKGIQIVKERLSYITTHPTLARFYPSLAVPNIVGALIHWVVQLQARVPASKKSDFLEKSDFSLKYAIHPTPPLYVDFPALSKTAALLSNAGRGQGIRGEWWVSLRCSSIRYRSTTRHNPSDTRNKRIGGR